jgi:hypothetical protein
VDDPYATDDDDNIAVDAVDVPEVVTEVAMAAVATEVAVIE